MAECIRPRLLIANGQVVTPRLFIPNGMVMVENGRIASVSAMQPGQQGVPSASEGYEVIDAQGGFIVPGFIDLHLHGGGGRDVMDADPVAIEEIARVHARYGTTGFLATTLAASRESILRSIEAVTAAQNRGTGGAEVLGIHLEGPYLSRKWKGAQDERFIRKPDIEEMECFIQAASGNLKMVTLAPELDGSHELLMLLQNAGVTAAVGHSDASFAQVERARELGLSHVAHTYNAMRGLHHSEPGVVGAALYFDDLTAEVIADGVHVHPAAVGALVKAKGTDKVILVTDAVAAAGMDEGQYRLGSQTVYVRDGQVRLASGVLAGSVLSMNRAVHNMIRFTGIALSEAITMATLNPARRIRVADRKGSLEPGKDADIVVMNHNFQVMLTLLKGKPIYHHQIGKTPPTASEAPRNPFATNPLQVRAGRL